MGSNGEAQLLLPRMRLEAPGDRLSKNRSLNLDWTLVAFWIAYLGAYVACGYIFWRIVF